MTVQELKQYVADKRKAKAAEWKKQIDKHGKCSSFTDKDYTQNRDIIFVGKSRYKTKFVHRDLYKITK